MTGTKGLGLESERSVPRPARAASGRRTLVGCNPQPVPSAMGTAPLALGSPLEAPGTAAAGAVASRRLGCDALARDRPAMSGGPRQSAETRACVD